MQVLGKGPRPGYGTHVRGDHHHILALRAKLLGIVVHKDGLAGQIVHRDIKEALDLVGVEVHGQHPVRPRLGNQVGYQLGGDGVPGLGLAVLPGVAKIGNNRRNAPGRGPLQRVNDDEEFHQVLVYRRAGGLDHKHIAAADSLIQRGKNFAVGESPHLGFAQFGAHQLANLGSQFRIGITGKHLDILAVRNHFQALFSIIIFFQKIC